MERRDEIFQETPLHRAPYRNISNIGIRPLASAQCDVKSKNSINNSPLHQAVHENNIERVKHLIDDGQCDVNVRGINNETPLHVAAWNNYDEIVRIILSNPNCDVNAKNEDQYRTPLHKAARNNSAEAVKLLLSDPRCEVNARDQDRKTALQTSASNNSAQAVQLLLADPRCDINAFDKHQKNPLHSAACMNSANAVKLLLEAQCDVNAQNESQETPLLTAVRQNRVETISILLSDKRCDVNAVRYDKKNVLHLICSHWKTLDCLRIILEMLFSHPRLSKGLTNVLDINGESAITLMLRNAGNVSHYESNDTFMYCLSLLTAIPGSTQACPHTLPLGVELSSHEVCHHLLINGAMVNSCFPDGESSLHCAVRKDSFDKVKLLVDAGANLEIVWRKMNPLMLATTVLLRHSISSPGFENNLFF